MPKTKRLDNDQYTALNLIVGLDADITALSKAQKDLDSMPSEVPVDNAVKHVRKRLQELRKLRTVTLVNIRPR